MRLLLLAIALALAGCATPEIPSAARTDQTIAVHTFADGTTRLIELGNHHLRAAASTKAGGIDLGTLITGDGAATIFTPGETSPTWGKIDVATGSLPIPAGGLTCWGDARMVVDNTGWYAVTLSYDSQGNRGLCLAVSRGTNPRGGWWLSYLYAGEADYPGITLTDKSLWVVDAESAVVWRIPLAAIRAGNLTPASTHVLSSGNMRPAVPRDRGGPAAWFVGVFSIGGSQVTYRLARIGDDDQLAWWSFSVDDLPELAVAPNLLPDGRTVFTGGAPSPALAMDATGTCGTIGMVHAFKQCDVFATQWRGCAPGGLYPTPFLAFTKRSMATATPLCFTHPAVTFDAHGTEWITMMGHGGQQWPQMHIIPLVNDGQWFFTPVNAAGFGLKNNPAWQIQRAVGPVPPGPVAFDYLGATTDSTTHAVYLGGMRGDCGPDGRPGWCSQTLRLDP